MADSDIVTIAQIADALATTLGAATSIKTAQSYNTLTEGIASGDCPLIQCYWQDWEMDTQSGDTDRMTFQGGVRHHTLLFHVDLYATQRAHLDEDIEQVHESVEELMQIFEAQDTRPYFDLDGIKSFQVTAERATFEYEGGAYRYPGARFYVTIRLF